MPKETNSGYGVAVSKSRPEYHRTALGGARPLIQRPKTVKSKRFISNTEKRMGKIPTPVLVNLVDSMLYGCEPYSKQMVFIKVLTWKIVFFCKNNNIFSFVPFLQ
jgi:hypothetical protein